MKRFAAWFRREWLEHRGLILFAAAGGWLLAWAVVLSTRTDVGHGDRRSLEAFHVLAVSVAGVLLAAGLFGSERRHGAASLMLRMPGARLYAFLARVALLVVTLAGTSVALALFGGVLSRIYDVHDWTPLVVPGATSVDTLESRPVETWFVFPRWIIAEALWVGGVCVAFALLASVCTKRTALAVAIGAIVPLAIAVPLTMLSADRPDFFDLRLPGAVAFVAKPLIALALAALIVGWVWGQRWLNRPRRAISLGLLCVLVGSAIAYAWTARAFAAFDHVEPLQAGFRLTDVVIDHPTSAHRGGPILSPSGRYLYVYAHRHDRGVWPWVERRPYGPWAQDFRSNRGTAPRLWRFDLETGEARQVGDGWGHLHARAVGLASIGLRSWSTTRRLQPRALGLLGPSRSTSHGTWGSRLFDLETGRVLTAPIGDLSQEERDRVSEQLRECHAVVRTRDGRPAWVEHGAPSVLVNTSGRTKLALGRRDGTWMNVPGGWAVSTPLHVTTLDAEDGRLLTVAAPRWGPPLQAKRSVDRYGVGLWGEPIGLSPRHVLGGLGPAGASWNWRWRLLDMETGEMGEVFEGPRATPTLRQPLPDGRLLCLRVENEKGTLATWDPRTNTYAPVSAPDDVASAAMSSQLYSVGSDARGNRILALNRKSGAFLDQRLYFFHFAENTLTRLQQPGPWGLSVVAIDSKDRVVALEREDHTGFKRILRITPGTGEREVVFPR